MQTGPAMPATSPTPTLDTRVFDAILFDLDGVITKTAEVHAAAWKQLFDTYLRKRAERTGAEFRPFAIDTDYRHYVDGKPRYDGVRSFLASRGIVVPEGQPDDPPERDTIYGLGNAKQACFLKQLEARGVAVYDTSVAFIRRVKACGLKVAVISSSRNCAAILDKAGLADWFDTRVDGLDREHLGLEGKPHPATFLEAARRLQVEPARAVVVEDAIAGVQAGRAGRFGCVIGVDRDDYAPALTQNGAHIVVRDLSELRLRSTSTPARLPSALRHLDDIVRPAAERQIVVFLDYDGTLTPIVTRPEAAHLSDAMRAVLAELARTGIVAIVSGRDLADVRCRVGLEPLYYAGSHGFEIAGPDGFQAVYGPVQAFLPSLDQAERALHDRLDRIPGVQVERKHFAIAIHYRRVHEDDIATVAAGVAAVQASHPRLRRSGGKKVFELRPELDWHKGTALFWLLDAMQVERHRVWPIYIGDDVTDEDAFLALQHRGVGIMVMDGAQRQTAAAYALADTEAVRAFLEALIRVRHRGETP